MGISADHPATLDAFSRQQNLKHLVLADFRRQVLPAYDALVTDDKSPIFRYAKRAYFVIDKTGVVKWAKVQENALDLLDREVSVERAARRAGYGSQAAFTRAFRAEYGEPPARYRGAWGEAERDGERERTAYRVELMDRPTLRVAMIEHRGDYRLTNKAFERLMAIAATTGLLTPDTRTLGIYYDDPQSVPEADLRSAACITVPDDWTPTGELEQSQVEGGRYARIVHTGAYTELEIAYTWLYRTWLPTSALEPRDLPCVEEYLNDPRQVPAKDLETAVLMPLVESAP